jgi:simple sugar transport system substrate-binding protein
MGKGRSKMRSLKALLSGGLIALSLVFGSGFHAAAADKDHAADWEKFKILFLVWSEESNPYFAPLINGAKDAAAQQGVNIDIQFGNSNATNQNTITETAIANGVDGILTTVWDDQAFTDVLCRAKAKGVAVLIYNIDHTKGPAAACGMAFMGQNFVDTGYAIGKRVIEVGKLKKGDMVFTPVETPNAVYADLRHAGVQKALDEIGAKSEMIGTGNDRANALTIMTQYLLGHPKTAAIIGLGQTPTAEAAEAIKEAGMNIPAGGFDTSEPIVKAIEDGSLIATTDTQPYSQGFFAVTQLALYLKYGLYPSDMATGGRGVIDKSNIAFIKKWIGVAR